MSSGYGLRFLYYFREAGIEVKKISGFAKGYGHSTKQQLTIRHETNHAWNAVFIRESWFLLDSTWGAGYLDKSGEFKAEFDEFYFLPNPDQLISSHFPYMNDDLVMSMKWQLLEDPVSLEKFNTLMRIRPEAFKIGIVPKSHLQGVINFTDELELSFKQEKELDNIFSTRLYQRNGNMLRKVQFSTYLSINGSQLGVKVKPPETGEYKLELFGRRQTGNATGSSPQLFEYVLHCEVPEDKSDMRIFPYPSAYPQAIIDDCQVLEPLGKQIPPKTEIKMRFRSPYLKRMMIHQTMMKKDGDVFEGYVTTPDKNYLIDVYGSRSDSGTLSGQYQFCVG